MLIFLCVEDLIKYLRDLSLTCFQVVKKKLNSEINRFLKCQTRLVLILIYFFFTVIFDLEINN